ncbi:MAG: YciI family protein [Ornithinimicrobium sp.]
MKYMLLLHGDPAEAPADETDPGSEEMQRWFAYTDALVQAGAMVGGEALHGTETATTVRVTEGNRVVTDGPFIEAKEALGGYYVIDVDDLDAAIDWAARVPSVTYGAVEVRPVMEIPAE